MNQKNVHWYPGHMAKALKQIEERLKVIDIVVELVDSRAPISSKNPFLEEITKNKIRLLLMTKKDLSDEVRLKSFIRGYEQKGYNCLTVDLNNQSDVKKIVDKIMELGKPLQEKYLRKGMKPQPIRAMIIGIPNVGKSTLINRLVKKRVASTANKAGHTRAQQWIRINPSFELLDTPGILSPHYDDHQIALNLALIGAMKEEILPFQEIMDHLIAKLIKYYPEQFRKRYSLEGDLTSENIYKQVAERRKLYLPKGEIDEYKVEHLLLKEFQDGVITKAVIDDA